MSFYSLIDSQSSNISEAILDLICSVQSICSECSLTNRSLHLPQLLAYLEVSICDLTFHQLVLLRAALASRG